MHRYHPVAAGAAIVLAAFGLTCCSRGEAPAPASAVPLPSAPAAVAAAQDAAVLPAAEVLTDLLYRLADTAVPGAEKLNLIEAAADTDADTLDRFTTALKDGGYMPLSFRAADVAWSDRNPGSAVANIDVATGNADSAAFSFPMEFRSRGVGWQLSRSTAEMLLAFGRARAAGAPGTAPAR